MSVYLCANSVPLIDLIVEGIMTLDVVDKRMAHIDTTLLAAQQHVLLALGIAQLEEEFRMTGTRTDELAEVSHNLNVAFSFKLTECLSKTLLIAPRDDHMSAQLGAFDGRSSSDARRCSCHKNRFVFEGEWIVV